MDAPAAMGAQMTRRVIVSIAVVVLLASPVCAQERHAIVIAGASGGEPYAAKLRGWEQSMVAVLRDPLQFEPGHIISLGEASDERGDRTATRAHVLEALDAMKHLGSRDLLFVILFGHGT